MRGACEGRLAPSVHVCKVETLRAAYEMAKQNDGAPGVDGVTFEAIEAQGAETLLEQLRDEDGAYLQATPSPEAGDTEGWRQSPWESATLFSRSGLHVLSVGVVARGPEGRHQLRLAAVVG